jgi:hypothetical protein
LDRTKGKKTSAVKNGNYLAKMTILPALGNPFNPAHRALDVAGDRREAVTVVEHRRTLTHHPGGGRSFGRRRFNCSRHPGGT